MTQRCPYPLPLSHSLARFTVIMSCSCKFCASLSPGRTVCSWGQQLKTVQRVLTGNGEEKREGEKGGRERVRETERVEERKGQGEEDGAGQSAGQRGALFRVLCQAPFLLRAAIFPIISLSLFLSLFLTLSFAASPSLCFFLFMFFDFLFISVLHLRPQCALCGHDF